LPASLVKKIKKATKMKIEKIDIFLVVNLIAIFLLYLLAWCIVCVEPDQLTLSGYQLFEFQRKVIF